MLKKIAVHILRFQLFGASSRTLCKFFAHGACLKGEHCEFWHDWKDPQNNVCTYYQKGACSYGSRCRYDHVKVSRPVPSSSSSANPCQYLASKPILAAPSGAPSVVTSHAQSVNSDAAFASHSVSAEPVWSEPVGHEVAADYVDVGPNRSLSPSDLPTCSLAAAGHCPRGEKCPHIHGDLCSTCGKHCLHPFRPMEREEHRQSCEKRQKHLEALKHSQDVECSVCLERVLSKATPAERKFGILSECDHPFCIGCIRNWRSTSPASGMDVNSALRTCPICRKLSYFVIPSVIWYATKEDKLEIVENYKAKLRSIDCKHFDSGNGNCPFGTSCFYKDGAVTEQEDMDLENEEEEDDEEEEEGGGGYEFRFSEDMDPLSFTHHDSSGLQPYQQFERLEHQANRTIDRELSAKRPRLEDVSGATMQEIMEVMNLGSRRRRPTKTKKRGRRKGSTNKCKDNPEVTRKLGDATLRFSMGLREEAIGLFNEVIRLSPNLPDPYHRLGLIYHEMGDKKRAFNFYMIAAHLTPKESSLWKLLVTWSIDEGDRGKARYCLSKALTADPEDIKLQSQRACLYVELGDYMKAADSYEQISRLCPADTNTIKTAARLYKKCDQQERAVTILEKFLGNFPNEVDLTVVDLLASLLMEANAHVKALELIEKFSGSEREMPLHLVTKAGICCVSLNNMEKADGFFQLLQCQNIHDQRHLIFEVGDSLMNHGHHESALKYYMMLTGDTGRNNGYLHLKIAECYSYLQMRGKSIDYFYKALEELENSVDARLTLSSLLLQEGKDDEAISVLLSPNESDPKSNSEKPWWLDGKIKLKLSQIYRSKGLTEAFVDVIWPVVHDTLFIETIQQKFRPRKRLAKSVLSDRIKVLGENQTDTVFQGFRPVALAADLSRASRAKRLLKKKETAREAKRAAALAAGIEWTSDNSEDESPQQAPQELPLPNLLKDEEHHSLLIDLCKGLTFLKRYWEALEIINLTLKLASNFLSVERKEEFRTLGAQIAYNISDPAHGWEYAKYIVNQHPNSFAAWNCYYRVISKLDSRFSKHSKFLHSMRVKHRSCVPVLVIFGHQFTMISQHQSAAREYLEAYKLMPDAPLVNLCVGTCLINLALGHRLQNKHQCVAQGLSFLQNNLRLCKKSQEALYNVARAFHHVGLVTLAAANYEKVLAMHESDYPIPTLPNENPGMMSNGKPGVCDLRREAAYNLHLIYKKSGAVDLARQVLKDYCVI